MITTVIARMHAVDRAGAGKNWLLAGLVAGTVVITGTGACRVDMVLGALLVTSAAWPLLAGTGATRIVGGLGAALALVPFAAACLLAELARTPPVSSRSA